MGVLQRSRGPYRVLMHNAFSRQAECSAIFRCAPPHLLYRSTIGLPLASGAEDIQDLTHLLNSPCDLTIVRS